MWKALLQCTLIVCLWGIRNVYAQNVLLPSAQLDFDYISQLIVSRNSSNHQFSYERRYLWSNNVIALREGNRKTLPRYQVSKSSPFYATNKLTRWKLSHQRWHFEFVEGYVSLIRGNTDAAQIWLDAKSKSIDPYRFYQPFASEQKGRWRWFGVGHTFPLTFRKCNGEVTLNFRYLLCDRFRDGWLSGSHYENRLLGEVQFVSSRGIGFNAPTGRGFAFDTTLSLRWSRWRAIAAVEGLYGQVRWKKLRKVSAFIDTGAFAEDPDGFLHSLPLLAGCEDYISVKHSIDRQWLLGLGYHQSRWLWGIAVSERNEGHNWHICAVRQVGNQQSLTLDLQLPNRTVSVGYHSPNFALLLSLSHFDLSKSVALGAQVLVTIQ